MKWAGPPGRPTGIPSPAGGPRENSIFEMIVLPREVQQLAGVAGRFQITEVASLLEEAVMGKQSLETCDIPLVYSSTSMPRHLFIYLVYPGT